MNAATSSKCSMEGEGRGNITQIICKSRRIWQYSLHNVVLTVRHTDCVSTLFQVIELMAKPLLAHLLHSFGTVIAFAVIYCDSSTNEAKRPCLAQAYLRCTTSKLKALISLHTGHLFNETHQVTPRIYGLYTRARHCFFDSLLPRSKPQMMRK